MYMYIYLLSQKCSLLVSALLTITLLDVNDNPPEFIPSDVYDDVMFPESSPMGYEVERVEAIDRDKNSKPIT